VIFWRYGSYLFNLIRAMPLSAWATHDSDRSREIGGRDERVHVSAFKISGSIMASSSSILSHMSEALDLNFKVASKSITN
jgi:hypothetical protein